MQPNTEPGRASSGVLVECEIVNTRRDRTDRGGFGDGIRVVIIDPNAHSRTCVTAGARAANVRPVDAARACDHRLD